MSQHQSPCRHCPFRKDIAPGALGGSTPETYVGQLAAGFWLPCHMDPTYVQHACSPDSVSGCAGAAILRENMGAGADAERHGLLRIKERGAEGFASLEEFYAHHRRIPLAQARAVINETTVRRLAHSEMQRAGVKVFVTEKKTS